MSTNLFRNILLAVSVLLMLTVAVVAYGRYTAVTNEKDECCLRIQPSHNTEMPWESLARQLMGAVVL